MPETGPDNDGEVRISFSRIGNDADGYPTVLLCTPRYCFHHAAPAATDENTLVLCDESPNGSRSLVFFPGTITGTYHRNLFHVPLMNQRHHRG